MNDHDLRALATALLKRYAAEEEQVSKMFDAIVIDRGEHVPLPEITEEERALLNMLGGRKGNSLEHKRGSLASRGCSCNCNCNCGNCSDDDDDDDTSSSSESADSASADASASAAADNAAAADSESASAAEAGASMSDSMSADNAAAADAESASAAEAGASMSASMSSEDATTASVSDAVAGDPSVSAEAAATAEENATTSEKGEVADSFGSLLGSISDNPDAPSAGATPASGQLSSELSAQLNEALANAVEEGDINDDALSQQSLDALAAQNADLDAALSGITAGLNAGDLSGMLGSTSVADQAANLTGASLDAASLSPDSAFSSNFTGIGTVGSNVTNADSKAGLQATSESVPGDVADQVDNMFANTRADTISPNVDDAITDESSKEGLQLGQIGTTNVNQGPTIAGLNKDDLSDVFSGRQSLLDALNNTQMTSLTIHGGKSAIDGTKGETAMGPVFGGPVNDVTTVDLITEDQAAKEAAKTTATNTAANTAATTAAANTAATPAANSPAASKNGVTAPANSGMAATLDAARDAASKGLLQNFLDTYGKTAVVAGETNYAGNVAALGPAVMAELQAANKAAQAAAAGGATLGGAAGSQTAATTPSTTAATAPAATTSPTTTAQPSTVSQPSVVAQTGAGKTGATTGAGTGETASSATGYDKGASTYTGIGLIDSKINNALNNPGTTLVNAGVSLVPGLGLANSVSGLVGGPTVGSVLAGLAGDVLGNGGTGGTGGGGTGGTGGGNGDGTGGGGTGGTDGGGTGGTGGTVDNTTVDDPTKGPGNDTLVGGGGNDTLKGGDTVVDTTPKTKMIGGREYVGLDSATKYGSGAERTFFRPWTKEVAAADGGYFDADQYFADGGLTTPTTTPGMPTTSSFPTMAFTDGQGAVGSIAQPPGVMPSDAVGFDGPNASPMAPAPSAAAPTMSVLQQNLGSRNTNASPAMAPVPQNPNVGYALGQSPLSNLRNS